MTDTPQDTPTPHGDTETTGTTTGRPRDGDGQFIRSIDTAKRDAEAAELRAQSLTYRQIAAVMGISKSEAERAVKRALAETVQEAGEHVRAMELEKLDALEQIVNGILSREHVMVSHGRLIKDDDGAPLPDPGPLLQAVQVKRALGESRRKLLGLDAPAQVVQDTTVRYEVVGVSPEELA